MSISSTALANLWLLAAAGAAQTAATPDRGVLRVPVPAVAGSLAPNLAASAGGLVMTWLAPLPAAPGTDRRRRPFALRMARLDRRSSETPSWTAPVTIHESSKFFANWADIPSVIEARDGSLYAQWLQYSGIGAYDYDVMLAHSTDGAAWRDLGRLHTDTTRTEHGFVSLVRDGAHVRGFWLDGRNLKKRGTMALMTRIIGAPDEVVLDPDVCTCCQTAAVTTESGALIVYRDHTKDEVRDISWVRKTKDGWSSPQGVHADGWRIAACPVNGPAIARTPNLLAVAWYSGAQATGQVLVAFSRDDGRSFAIPPDGPIVIDAGKPIGRVAIACLDDAAIVCWLGQAKKSAVLRLRRVTQDGRLGEPLVLATTRGSRSTGFPRLLRVDDTLVVVWRDVAKGARLRSAIVPLAAVPQPD